MCSIYKYNISVSEVDSANLLFVLPRVAALKEKKNLFITVFNVYYSIISNNIFPVVLAAEGG